MVDRYYTWFLNNYQNYKYVGPKSKAVLQSIKDFIARNDPNIYNFSTVYASFMALYKGNIVASIKFKDGITPLKSNYYLLFEEDEILVPLAYIEFYKRVSELELENICRAEIRKREIYYDSLVGQKEVLVNKCDRLIRNSGNHNQEVKNAKANCLIFLAFTLLPLGTIIGLLFDDVVVSLGLTAVSRWLIFSVSVILFILYIVVSWGFFEDIKTLNKGKKINQFLFDIELKLHTNTKNLKMINIRKMVVAIKGGKKYKQTIVDDEYKEQYYSAEDDMEELEKGRIVKSQIKKIMFIISNCFLVFFLSLVSSFLCVRFCKYSFPIIELYPISSSALITIIMIFPNIKLFNSTRIRNIVIVSIISLVISLVLWLGLVYA